jgi:hypothetical protein
MTAGVVDQIDWAALYFEYVSSWSAVLAGGKTPKPVEPSPRAVDRLTRPTDADTSWLSEALRQGTEPPIGRKWFVAQLFRRSSSFAEVFLVPMLDAGIDEVDPSWNRYFIEPCMNAFGPRRVNEYLLDVLESGTDSRKAGAASALYWAHVPLVFPGGALSHDIEFATPESRAELESLQDVWERKHCLLLETFVANSSLDVRRSIIPGLDLDPLAYPESHRPLVSQAIELARHHEDDYIRHRVEVQLGDVSEGLAPLPQRGRGPAST